MARHADIMAPASGGFNLTRLANAAHRWLDMKVRRIDDAAELERQEEIIRVQLLRFFATYHGG